MGRILKWFRVHRERLVEYFNEKHPRCTPTDEWWVVASVLQTFVERIERTFYNIQGTKLLMSEQKQELDLLVDSILQRTHIEGPLNLRQRMENIDKLKEDPNYGFSSSDGSYFVQSKDIKNCIDEVGGYASLETDFLQESDDPDDWETYLRILETLSEFAFDIIQGTRNIVSEQDSRGGPANE